MPGLMDLKERRFGRLVAKKLVPKDEQDQRQGRRWLCVCDCRQETEARVKDLLSGNTTSCGCRKRATFHGLRRRKGG